MGMNKCTWSKNTSEYEADCGYNAVSSEKKLKDINFIFCPKCGREIECVDETREEVLYIIRDAFEKLESIWEDDCFCVPNGTVWKYSDVLKYLEKNLKKEED